MLFTVGRAPTTTQVDAVNDHETLIVIALFLALVKTLLDYFHAVRAHISSHVDLATDLIVCHPVTSHH